MVILAHLHKEYLTVMNISAHLSYAAQQCSWKQEFGIEFRVVLVASGGNLWIELI